MPRYDYIAIAAKGKKAKGTITAENAYAARKQLRMRGIHPTSINETSALTTETSSLFAVFRRKNKNQLIDFTKEMSTLLNSGIKLTEALAVLTQQATDPGFKNALSDIKDRVVTGESFTDTLKDYGDYFDIIYISMVHVGEVTGSLGDVFATVANFMSKRQKVEAKIKTAMIYPGVLSVCCLIAVLFLTVKVIPTIAKQIQANGSELPWITKQFMNISHILTSWWILVVIVSIIAVIWAFKRFLKTDKGAHIRDKFMISVPVFGPLIKQRVVARFTSTLSTLLGSGLNMADSLKVVSEVTGNTIMSDAVNKARERILSGADISTPLRDSGVISPTIAHMVAVGEKSGELELMLKNISENLEASTDIVIERLSAAVEPLIIVVMAGVIGLIAYATLLPILQVSAGNF